MQGFNEQIKREIECKYEAKLKFLRAALERAEFEEKLHARQESTPRYKKLGEYYGNEIVVDLKQEMKRGI